MVDAQVRAGGCAAGDGGERWRGRPGRVGRNPRTGQKVEISEKNVPYFKTGKLLKERLNK